MAIIGCDFHPSWHQIASLDSETEETGEHKLVHAIRDATRFYEQLSGPVLMGMAATGKPRVTYLTESSLLSRGTPNYPLA